MVAGQLTVACRCLLLLLAVAAVAEGYPISAQFQLLTCDPHNGRQLFNLTGAPDNWIAFRTVAQGGFDPDGNNCIDCMSCNVGAIPHLWYCPSAGASQPNPGAWTAATGENCTGGECPAGGAIQLKTTQSEACFGVGDLVYGATAFLKKCNASDSTQLWHYDIASGVFEIYGNRTLCLDGGTPLNISCATAPYSSHAYCDPTLASVDRAKDLVSRMLPSEKAQNMVSSNPGVKRLGVPPFAFSEALHGVASDCGATAFFSELGQNNSGCPTSFPHALALGATFNRSLWKQIGQVISTEARALNNQEKMLGHAVTGVALWTPDINLFRDPRWGRGQEVPSEDPSLNAAYAMQYVRGLQEDPEHPGALKVVSTGKHYFAYDCENCRALGDPCMPDSTNSCTTDRTKFDANVSKRDLVEYYWPAWRAAAGGGKISSVMCSYNAINSVPACGNDYGMNTILRGQFNFTGAVVSDCGAVGDGAFSAYVKSKFGGDQRRQAALGVQSGCDLNCGSFYTGHVPDAVDANILPQADVDIALERIWKMNIELGLLDKPSKRNPFRDVSKYGPRQVDTPRSRALALSAAEQSMTLLKNTGSLLPLALNSTRVALIGPQFNVTTEMLSIYASESNQLVREHSPWSAFKRGGARITASVRGCNDTLGDGQSDIDCMEDSQFTAAAAAAKGADVVLLFLGIRPAAFTPKNASSGAWEGEGRDRISTGLPGLQAELLRRVTEANKHTVLILINGGMLSIENIIPDVAAILECRYPGQLGGDAIFKTVFGMNAPAGRLTTTWYPSTFTATRPITDMSLRDHGGITYMHYDKKPVFPFGFGLSYSKFEFRAVEDSVRCTTVSLAAHHLDYLATAGEEQSPCALHVQATNTGMVPSDIVILGFLRSTHADAPRNKELFGFVREVAMIPREARTVLLSVPAQVLSLVDEDGSEHLRSGRYTLEVGVEGSAEMVPTRATLEVEGADVELFKTSPQDE